MKLRHKPLKKHSSYITHLDFSTDSNHLHSNDGRYIIKKYNKLVMNYYFGMFNKENNYQVEVIT